MKREDAKGGGKDGRAPAAQSGTEVLADGILLIFKFVEVHLVGAERRFYKELKPGEYVPLETLKPVWESLTQRIPREMKAAIKGMTFRTKGILAETGVQRPADALRVSNEFYQAFNRGPRIGGIEVVSASADEAVVDNSTWVGCTGGAWFFEAIVRAFGARGVHIEHLKPCQRLGDRYCRYRGRWAGMKHPR
ncbi:MAG: hypothetical protein ACE5FC_04215 [Myxococcota bacterium]